MSTKGLGAVLRHPAWHPAGNRPAHRRTDIERRGCLQEYNLRSVGLGTSMHNSLNFGNKSCKPSTGAWTLGESITWLHSFFSKADTSEQPNEHFLRERPNYKCYSLERGLGIVRPHDEDKPDYVRVGDNWKLD